MTGTTGLIGSSLAAASVVDAVSTANPACFVAPSLCVAGEAVGAAASGVAGSALSELAAGFTEGAESLIREVFSWWLHTPSVQVADSGVLKLQGVVLGIAALVGVVLVSVQGIRMAVTRRGAPLAELVSGALVGAAIVAGGVVVVDLALVAGDRLAEHIMVSAFGSTDAVVERMVTVLFSGGFGATALALVFAVVVILAGFLQTVLFFLRQAAIPLLALMFPLVAMGQLGPPATRRWLPSVGSAVLAIVVYKPLVALVLAAGFIEIGEGKSVVDVARGFTTLALSVIALPAMLRLFTPIVGRVGASGGPSGGLLGASAAGLALVSARRGTPGDVSASEHASFMASQQGSASGGGTPPTGASSGPAESAPWQAPAESAASQARSNPAASTASSAAGVAHPAAAAAQVVVVAAGQARDAVARQVSPDEGTQP
jgi:hypothetical protein